MFYFTEYMREGFVLAALGCGHVGFIKLPANESKD